MRQFVTLVLAIVLAACATSPHAPDAVRRGELDTREYRYLELPNRLRVLLVSDIGTDQSAASLRVEVGSGDDPRDRQGLAHFLEHMLFLGTSRYPRPDEYQDFINAHGGSHNAYTALDHTNYFFDISPESLEPALDRFAQFFVAPLFNADYVQREVNAVDSEYRMGLKDDARREYDVLRELVQPEHPLAGLSVGNLETLGPERGDIRGELVSFHERRYSANLMTLVVLGREPLDALQTMVESRFGSIPDHGAEARSTAPALFAPTSLPLEIRIRPEKELRELTLAFPVPSARERYAAKPFEYIGNLLGHEGPGSLLSVLKARGWAESLGAGAGFDMYDADLFQVSISLTEAGLEHRGEITALTLRALEMLHQRGVEQWRYREQGALGELGFRFREKGSPTGTVIALVNTLRDYPPAEVLRGPYLYADFDRVLILDHLRRMRADNVLVTLSAKGVSTDRSSRWFGTPYATSRLDATTLDRVADPALLAALELPLANEFVPRQVATKPREDGPARPVALLEERGYRLWHLQDAEFPGPRGSVYFQLLSPGANDTAEHTALGVLFARLVQDQLNEYTYPATLAGLEYGVAPSARGLVVKLSGFDDRQPVLIEKILRTLAVERFAPDRFASLKAETLRELGNSTRERPLTQLLDGLASTLVRRNWSDAELQAALGPADADALATFARELKRRAAVEVLVHGNFQHSEALAIGAQVRDALRGAEAGEVPAVEVREIPRGEFARSYRIDHPDSALLMYLQGGAVDESERGRVALSGQILGPLFFNELRTERQLGYVVFAQPYPLARAPGLLLAVQSPAVGAAGLAGEFEAFLARQQAAAATLADEEFARHRQALVERLRETPKSLNEKSERLWADIGLGSYGFDDRERVAAAVERIEREEWVRYFSEQIAGAGRRALLLHSTGSTTAATAAGKVPGRSVESDPHWQSDAKYYRFDWPVSVQDAERALHL